MSESLASKVRFGVDLEEIERIEKNLQKENFKTESSTSVKEDFFEHKTVYTCGQESVIIYKYNRIFLGHTFGTYKYGDVRWRLGEDNSRKILMNSSLLTS